MDRRTFLGDLALMGLGFIALRPSKVLAAGFCQQSPNPYLQSCEVGIRSSLIEQDAQHSSEWCWAASMSMIFSYYGHPISQERIVGETWGSIINMPSGPQVVLRDLNKNWTDDNGNRFDVSSTPLILKQSSLFPTTPQQFGYAARTAISELDNDRPLFFGSMGHATVLSDIVFLEDNMGNLMNVYSATVRGPWPGRGRRVLTAQEWFGTDFIAAVSISD